MIEADAHDLALPKDWPGQAVRGMSKALELAAMLYGRLLGRIECWQRPRAQLLATVQVSEHKRLMTENILQILKARMARVAPHRRPHYTPMERRQILELKAGYNWSIQETARLFQVEPNTVAAWLREDRGEADTTRLQPHEPVNRYDDGIRRLVRSVRAKCPMLGKRKIAAFLLQAGIWLHASTIGRVIKEKDRPVLPPDPEKPAAEAPPEPAPAAKTREIIARCPNHTWHVDLTVVPVLAGLALTFLPFALPQCWPWAWCALVVVDHYSRRCMGIQVFVRNPTSEAAQQALQRIIDQTHATPKYVICDKGRQFDCDSFRDWCERKGIERPRYGKVGKYGSIAVVERLILSLKDRWTRRILVPFNRVRFTRLLTLFVTWYNHCPHERFGNLLTPQEVYDQTTTPKSSQPRFEPRARIPATSKLHCKRPPIRGSPGVRLELRVRFLDEEAGLGTRCLPVVELQEKPAA